MICNLCGKRDGAYCTECVSTICGSQMDDAVADERKRAADAVREFIRINTRVDPVLEENLHTLVEVIERGEINSAESPK